MNLKIMAQILLVQAQNLTLVYYNFQAHIALNLKDEMTPAQVEPRSAATTEASDTASPPIRPHNRRQRMGLHFYFRHILSLKFEHSS